MTAAAWSLLALAALAAVVDWVAVGRDAKSLELVAKPAVLVLLTGTAVALHPEHAAVRWWFVGGLVLSLAGDVFLVLRKVRFVEGLASFLLGHVCYVVGLWSMRQRAALWPIALVVVAAGVGFVGRRVVASVRGSEPKLVGPVVGYVCVISLMLVSAFGSGNPWAIGGALLFYVSDGALAWNRFVGPFRSARLIVMTTYHLAQVGLVLFLLPR